MKFHLNIGKLKYVNLQTRTKAYITEIFLEVYENGIRNRLNIDLLFHQRGLSFPRSERLLNAKLVTFFYLPIVKSINLYLRFI